MKRIFNFLMALAVPAMMLASNGNDDKETYTADVSSSEITWVGKKVTGKHNGTITLQSGSLHFEDEMLVGGEFTLDMTSIANLDMAGKGGAAKLEGHLKSADFFNVAEFPTASFKITKVVPYGTTGDYKVVGNLTIKETTKEIKFMANVMSDDDGKVAMAELAIDRSDYNVKYGSGSFFDGLGDNAISDMFYLGIKLAMTKSLN